MNGSVLRWKYAHWKSNNTKVIIHVSEGCLCKWLDYTGRNTGQRDAAAIKRQNMLQTVHRQAEQHWVSDDNFI